MKADEDKIIYEIYINNKQFSCLIQDTNKEENIPSILGFQDLIFIKRVQNDNSIKIYYELKNLVNVSINYNKREIFKKLFPISISLRRLRDFLSIKLNKNFNYLFNTNIIQIQEESFFCLKDIIRDNTLYLCGEEFDFIDFKNENSISNENSLDNFKKEEIIDAKLNDKGNSINENSMESKEGQEINKNDNDKNIKEDISETQKDNQNYSGNEIEYELYNNNSLICKLKIFPELSLDLLREKIIKLIPRRTSFINKDKKIEPSLEDKITVKEIAIDKKIYLEFPIEDRNDTMEFEIYLNGKSYIIKEFYLHIKLKYVRINLKFDKSYKLCYKGKYLTSAEENQISLDELCYKELKVYFVKSKDEDDNNKNNLKISLNNHSLNPNFILETKNYPHRIFRSNEDYNTWIIMGKERSGKTTFINCLCNYLNEIKFEDNFRYSIEERKQDTHQIYDIQDSSLAQKIRAIEFPGFSGCLDEDKIINGNIKKFIKTLSGIQLICFVISGNETRLTDDLKNIFSNIWDIFSFDIKKNFVFILTNCDAKQPPALDTINSLDFSKVLSKVSNNYIFKFNNSYLYETNEKEFWDTGSAHYNEFMDSIKNIKKIDLNLSKKYIDLNNKFPENSKNFLGSIKKILNSRYYFNILKNINSYDKESNEEIPYDFYEITNICSQCRKKKYTNGVCQYCGSTRYIQQKFPYKKVTLNYLRNNNRIYSECYNRYKMYLKENIIYSASLYQPLKECYKLKLVHSNDLKNDICDFLNKNEKDKKNICKEIKYQDDLYKDYSSLQGNVNFKNFLDEKIIIN